MILKAGFNSGKFSGGLHMKKTILTCALALGILAVAVEVRAERHGLKPAGASFDAPPPDCWPDCGPQKTTP
jgi:hypothetical protein